MRYRYPRPVCLQDGGQRTTAVDRRCGELGSPNEYPIATSVYRTATVLHGARMFGT
jgi:hypothetical protein